MMKPIQKMTRQEFIDFCVEKKHEGTSFRSFHDIFEKHQIDEATRKIVLEKLLEIDKSQKQIRLQAEKTAYKRLGIKKIFIGIAILLFGGFLLLRSMEAGVIFIFNILVLLAGTAVVLSGMLNIVTGVVKKY